MNDSPRSSSPSLTGRAAIVLDGPKVDLASGNFTNRASEWLRGLGWEEYYLENLGSAKENFFDLFLQQICEYQKEDVFQLVPRQVVDKFMKDRRLRIQMLRAFAEELEAENDSQLDLYSMSFEERALNQKLFSEIVPGRVPPDLKKFLLERGWTQEDLEEICAATTVDDFIIVIAQLALDKLSLDVIVSLPEAYKEPVLQEISSQIMEQEYLLDFCEDESSSSETDEFEDSDMNLS